MRQVLKLLVGAALLVLVPQATLGSDPKIAFFGYGDNNSPSGIWVMDEDGSNKTLIYCAGRPHWSPDGSSVVLGHGPAGDGTLYRVDLADGLTPCGQAAVLAESTGIFVVPDGSPEYLEYLDGQQYSNLLESKWSPGRDEVAVNLNPHDMGIGIVAVANPYPGITDPIDQLVPIYATTPGSGQIVMEVAWNHDGSLLAVVQRRDDNINFHTIRIVDRVTGAVLMGPWGAGEIDIGLHESSRITAIEWARKEGSYRIAFQSLFPTTHPSGLEWRVVIVDFVATMPWVEDVVQGRSPSWSPDDTHLVFGAKTARGNSTLRMNKVIKKVNLDTGEVTTLGGSYPGAGSPGCDWVRAASFCGDGNCGTGESPCNCPTDCDDPTLTEVFDCSDGIDNDCDQDTDCSDSDCFLDQACQCTHSKEKGPRCSDGIDNDCDGMIDGDDPDC